MFKKVIEQFKKWKGVVSFLLALLVLFTSISISWDYELYSVYADETTDTTDTATSAGNNGDTGAQSRVKTFIKMAAGKAMSSEDTESLTLDELRFLGVYVSNYYIPFFTELGVDEESFNKAQKERIAKVISANLKFDETVSGILVDNIVNLSRKNYEEMVIATSEDGKTFTVTNEELTYDIFLKYMLGRSGYSEEKESKLYFGYQKDGTFVPTFDCILDKSPNNASACQTVFRQCLSAASIEDGYGFSIFDFTAEEAESSEDLLNFMNSDENFVENSIFGAKMATDCFGNIIFLGKNHQYVVVPGCMNPYAWVKVDANGKDVSTGLSLNIINYNEMSLADSGNLISEYKKDKKTFLANQKSFADVMNTAVTYNKEDKTYEGLRITSKEKQKKAKGEKKAKPKYTAYLYRMVRGSKITTKKESKWMKRAKAFIGKDDSLDYKIAMGVGTAQAQLKYVQKPSSLNDGLGSSLGEKIGSEGYTEFLNTTSLQDYNTGFAYNEKSNRTVPYLSNIVFIDNLQAFGFGSDTEVDTNTFNFKSYIKEDTGEVENKMTESYAKSKSNAFSGDKKYKFGASKNKKNAGDFNSITVDEVTSVMLYTTYAVAGLYEDDEISKKNTVGKLGYRMNIEGLPFIENSKLDVPESAKEDMMLKDIRNWIYYILHPSKGQNYFKTLVKNKLNATLVGWHNDMLGTNSVGATTGVSLYRSTTGYVTTPDLSEIQWTNSLINLYNTAIPFLIVIMLIIMLFAFVSGIMSFQKSLFGLIIFSCFLFTPVTLINNVVGLSNNISQGIYGEKFTYWALVQQESYASAIDEASQGESYDNYLSTLYEENSKVYTNQGNNSIQLKWQAPKKMASLMLSSKQDTGLVNGLKKSRVVKTILSNNSMSGESYLGNDSDYMYRSYIDLANFARYTWRGINTGTAKSTNTQNVTANMSNRLQNLETTYTNDIDLGYTNDTRSGGSKYSDNLRLTKPFTSVVYKNAVSQKGTLKNLTSGDYVGIHQDVFKFSIPMFNKKGVTSTTLVENIENANSRADVVSLLSTAGSSEDAKSRELTGIASYALMSESPFYYYAWGLYDQGLAPDTSSQNYKDLILGQDNGGYFYNMKGNGELKDFMDMRSLFTYIIPLLKEGNDVVREWDDVYGIKLYEGVPVEEGHQDDPDIVSDPTLAKKYWHNLNVARLYEIYSPWVDLMYDSSYAKPTNITVMGQKVRVEDPLDPTSYPSNRPMIFSESEMYDMGLSEADLTEVERRILKCNRLMEERMYELLNYYNFSDVTLDTAAAINCTFAFNKVFSSNGWIFRNNINLYPQSFEINDFSYDAFLRFILSNTIGEDITNQQDFYQTVVDKSSTTTAIMYIIDDILSQYLLPAFKIFFIMAIFLSAVLLIVATSFKVDPEQKFIGKLIKGICIPMLGLFAINIGFSWVVSLFMGVGNNAVTQSNILSIQTGDPVIAMLIIGALDIASIVLYIKLIGGVIEDIKHNFKLSTAFVQGAIGGTVQLAGNVVREGRSAVSNIVNGTYGSEGVGRYAEEGTGRHSARASQRASQGTAKDRNESPTRINEAKRETFKQSDIKEDSKNRNSKKNVNDINNTIKKGSQKIENNTTGNDRVNRKNNGNNKVKDSGNNR